MSKCRFRKGSVALHQPDIRSNHHEIHRHPEAIDSERDPLDRNRCRRPLLARLQRDRLSRAFWPRRVIRAPGGRTRCSVESMSSLTAAPAAPLLVIRFGTGLPSPVSRRASISQPCLSRPGDCRTRSRPNPAPKRRVALLSYLIRCVRDSRRIRSA